MGSLVGTGDPCSWLSLGHNKGRVRGWRSIRLNHGSLDEVDNMKEFDVVVWGATGFTGRLVAEYLAETYGTEMDQLSWAVAGRSEAKLRSVAEEFGFSGVPRLVADSMDEESIRAMAERTRVVCTTVGPYACLLYTSPSPRDRTRSRMPSSA